MVTAAQEIDSHVELLASETLSTFTSETSFEEATPLRRFIQEGRELSGRLDGGIHGGSSRHMVQYIEHGPPNFKLVYAWVQTAKDLEVASPEARTEILRILNSD